MMWRASSDIAKPPTSLRRCIASVMIAREFARTPPKISMIIRVKDTKMARLSF